MRFLLLALVISILAIPSFGLQIQAIRAVDPPIIDGKLDDACWQRLPDASEFVYSETGTPAAEETEAWICYDSNNIYVAFRCYDSKPDKIVAQQVKRGGSIATDDRVIIGVDPWHEHRSLYYFYCTPRGTQSETIPDGGGSKVEWRGDWYAAATQDDTGWYAEMAIPWEILKYPKGQQTIGLVFWRHSARFDMQWSYPDLGPNMDEHNAADWQEVEPPHPKLRTVGLHYTNVGLGGVAFKNGLDIKHQLSRQINGLLTVNPDFASIEQDVESIDFTYFPRVLTDRRPFFQEGGDFTFPREHQMFYSRNITDVDVGVKVTGRSAKHAFSGLYTSGGSCDNHLYCKSNWNFGKINSAGFALASTRLPDIDNDVVSIYGTLGKRTNLRTDTLNYVLMKSSTSGEGGDGTASIIHASGEGGPKQLAWNARYMDIEPDYFAADGLVPDPDLKGLDYGLGYGDQYDEGRLRGYFVGSSAYSWRLHDGDRLSRGAEVYGDIWGVGWMWHFSVSGGSRRHVAGDGTASLYHDRHYSVGFGWNQTDMFRRGWIDVGFGKLAGGNSQHIMAKQAIKLGGSFHSDLSVEYLRLTGPNADRQRQSVASITYDLSAERSISARVIERNGKMNVSCGFRQAVRRGADLYILFGDPNADKTVNRVTLKLIRPLF